MSCNKKERERKRGKKIRPSTPQIGPLASAAVSRISILHSEPLAAKSCTCRNWGRSQGGDKGMGYRRRREIKTRGRVRKRRKDARLFMRGEKGGVSGGNEGRGGVRGGKRKVRRNER